jgi:hypothetical protein
MVGIIDLCNKVDTVTVDIFGATMSESVINIWNLFQDGYPPYYGSVMPYNLVRPYINYNNLKLTINFCC